jgi:hypothetical protein
MKAVAKLLAGGVAIAAFAFAFAAPAAAQYYPPYGGYGYGMNRQALVNQCIGAVQDRLLRHSYAGYGYGGYGAARVLGVNQVSPRDYGGVHVRGVATGGSGAPDLRFDCRTDGRGFIRDIDIDRLYRPYGYAPYNPYDYSQYGYRRY